MRIDAHQHFWNYEAQKHAWINNSMKAIRKDFSPFMLKRILDDNRIDGCVAVQVDQSEDESLFLLQLAAEHPFIKGVVGWVDFQGDNIKERLDFFKQFPTIKGFRHIVQSEADPMFLQKAAFQRGINCLKELDLTYDILIYPHQMKMAAKFASDFPSQRFVVDHLAKPDIKNGLIEEWSKDLRALAAQDNVWCKISGLVTEADWVKWQPEDFFPYLETAVEAFGMKRLMYGSDWPVCLVAADYSEVLGIVEGFFQCYSEDERRQFFGKNTCTFYKLN
jgi:L-fuconolactonase